MGRKLWKCMALRHPKTTQERRESQEGWGRCRRNLHNMVQAYDDIPRTVQRSWKEHRKMKYHRIKDMSQNGLDKVRNGSQESS